MNCATTAGRRRPSGRSFTNADGDPERSTGRRARTRETTLRRREAPDSLTRLQGSLRIGPPANPRGDPRRTWPRPPWASKPDGDVFVDSSVFVADGEEVARADDPLVSLRVHSGLRRFPARSARNRSPLPASAATGPGPATPPPTAAADVLRRFCGVWRADAESRCFSERLRFGGRRRRSVTSARRKQRIQVTLRDQASAMRAPRQISTRLRPRRGDCNARRATVDDGVASLASRVGDTHDDPKMLASTRSRRPLSRSTMTTAMPDVVNARRRTLPMRPLRRRRRGRRRRSRDACLGLLPSCVDSRTSSGAISGPELYVSLQRVVGSGRPSSRVGSPEREVWRVPAADQARWHARCPFLVVGSVDDALASRACALR